jgi:hypothetical protein
MVLDIQTVYSSYILKNTAVQNVNRPFVYITDLTSTLKIRRLPTVSNIPYLLDWASPPIERRPRMSAAFVINFFKERRPRMSAALNSVIIFHRQNGDI